MSTLCTVIALQCFTHLPTGPWASRGLVWHSAHVWVLISWRKMLGRGGSQCVCYVNDGRQTDTQTRFFLASIPNPGEWLEARERELGPGEEDDDWIWGLKLPDNFSFFFLVLSLSLWQPSCSPCVHIHHYKTGHRRHYICLVQCDILTVLQRTWHIVVAQYF